MNKQIMLNGKKVRIDILKYHLISLNNKRSLKSYLCYLQLKILPLIQVIELELINKINKETDHYLAEIEKLEKKILLEIKAIVEIIKQRLNLAGLIDNLQIKSLVEKIDSVLDHKEETFYAYKVYNSKSKRIRKLKENESPERKGVFLESHKMAMLRLKALFCEIVAIGKKEIVEDYVESFVSKSEYFVDYSKTLIYQCNECFKQVLYPIYIDKKYLCSNCRNSVELIANNIRENVYIESFKQDKFVPSFFKLDELENAFWNGISGAWCILNNVVWSCDISNKDYFRKKLFYKNVNECRKSKELLLLNKLRLEVRNLKRNGKNNKSYYLNKDLINNSLGIVYKQIFSGDLEFKSFQLLESLELVFPKGVNLKLIVKWKGNLVSEHNMHSFQNQDQERCQFFKELIKNPKTFIELRETDSKKYLRDAGFTGIFYNEFVFETNKRGAILKTNKLEVKNFSDAKLIKILEKIDTFKFCSWK